jgi:tRNA U34 2-thiouridine synthase MnmA/TrmU
MPVSNSKAVRGLGLCSGGLDSILAAFVLRRQGIDVDWIAFETPFFSAAKARRAAARYGIGLMVRDITGAYMQMLNKPQCGYGKHMNPCLDCHALMFRLAGSVMKENGYDFMFSGEVLGQRPMSQTGPSLRYVEKHSAFEGFILRPLSARLLPPTLPEIRGQVDRSLLLDLSGRSRKRQIAMARQFGVDDYPAPAGGCLLTDKGYSLRLKDFLAHRPDGPARELHLLRYGRHLRLSAAVKLIVGRTQQDNEHIQDLGDPSQDLILTVQGYAGPTGLIPANAEPADIEKAAAICAGYSKAPRHSTVTVRVHNHHGQRIIAVQPLDPQQAKALFIR